MRYTGYILFAILMVVGFYMFHSYIILDFNLIAGILVLPLLLRLRTTNNGWLVPALTAVFLCLSFLTPERSVLFIAWALLLIQLLNYLFNIPVLLPLILMVVISPLFKFINTIIGFPLRLWLSNSAGNILKSSGMEVVSEGNVILFKGVPFFVNEACAGMNMLSISLLAAVAFLAYFSHQFQRKISFLETVFIMLLAIVSNVIANLIRILFVTTFMSFPGEPLHDIIGLVCLFFYSLMPLFFVVRWRSRIAIMENQQRQSHNLGKVKYLGVHFIMVLLLTSSGFGTAQNNKPVDHQIRKFSDHRGIVYLKQINNFYNSSHDPQICWTGSGYALDQINTSEEKGIKIYTGTLRKEDAQLYTSWWWTNGTSTTIDPLKWRYEMLHDQRPFYLVNVTAADKETLEKMIDEWMNCEVIKPAIFPNSQNSNKL